MSEMLPKWARVLNALRHEAKLKIEDVMTLVMIETEDGQTLIAHPMRSGGEEVYIPAQIMINDFIAFCESLDEGDIPIVIPTAARDKGEME